MTDSPLFLRQKGLRVAKKKVPVVVSISTITISHRFGQCLTKEQDSVYEFCYLKNNSLKALFLIDKNVGFPARKVCLKLILILCCRSNC